MAYLSRKGEKAPLLSHLTVISLLMAAKLNEPLVPAFENMVNMINGWQKDHMTNRDLVILEEKIIKALEFELNWTSPLHFLERFQRLFNLDQVFSDKHSYLVDASAIYLSRFMIRDVNFLEFKPSEIAVAAFMLALNANLDTPLSKALDVELLDKELINVDSYFQDTTIRIRINGSTHCKQQKRPSRSKQQKIAVPKKTNFRSACFAKEEESQSDKSSDSEKSKATGSKQSQCLTALPVKETDIAAQDCYLDEPKMEQVDPLFRWADTIE